MNMDTYNLDAMNEVGCSSGLDEASAMPSLLGDFYYEPDDVTRGLTLFDTPGILTLFDTPGHSLTRLSDSLTPLTRLSDGLTLFDTPGMGMNTDCSKGTGRSGDTPGMGMDTDISQCTVGIAQVQTFDQFVGTDILPVVPADEFWTCGATTLYIQCDRPASLMNTFLQFLHTQVVRHKLKVTTKKYAIKADVYLDNVRCTLKARAYQQEPGKIAFEIQKRQGDSLAFAGVYRSAAKYLQQQNFRITSGMPKDPVGGAGVPLDFPRGKVDVRSYEPLLDMASLTESPKLQAESAVALAAATEDPAVVEALCSEVGPMQDITRLLEPECMDIVFPVAILLLNIARYSSSAAYLVNLGLLHTLLDKVRCLPTSPSPTDASSCARQNFAQALALFATPSCRMQMSDQDAGNLAREVQQVMADSQDSCSLDPAYGNLQTAYFNLAKHS